MAGTLWSGSLITYVLYTKNLDDWQFSVISILMVTARIFDGLNDPVMGNVLEVTRTKWGKFKPWIAIGMLASAVVFIVSFSTTLDGWSYVVLFGVLYYIFSIVFTVNDIAYWGMLPSLTSVKEERDLLTSRAVMFAGIGAALATLLVPTFTAGKYAIGGNALTAYRYIAIMFAACFVGAQMITLVGVKEKPLPPKGEMTVNRVSLKTVYRTIRGNDQLSWAIAVFLMNTIGNTLLAGGLGTSYIYFEFGYNGLLFTIFSALGGIASGAVMLFFTPISKRFTRRQMMNAAAAGIVCGYALMLLFGLFVPASAGMLKFALLMVTNIFSFTGQSIYYLILMICIANTVEYNEWKTGVRSEGIIFSVRPFLTKLGWAVVQLIVLAVFLITGVRDYTNQIAVIENNAVREMMSEEKKAALIEGVLQSAPHKNVMILLAFMTLVPIALAIGAHTIYTKKFSLDEERYAQIVAELKARRAAREGQIT